MEDKAALRALYAREREAVSNRAAAEEALRGTLFSLPAWESAPLICGYESIRSEINTAPIRERALSLQKAYALPVTVTDTREGHMIFRRITGAYPEELTPARFGIAEPAPTCPALSLPDFSGALILVPGLAFDDHGFRIGYGGGYYDRFLALLRANHIPHTTVGLAFSACRPPVLPHESHDIPVDLVLDERRITYTHG